MYIPWHKLVTLNNYKPIRLHPRQLIKDVVFYLTRIVEFRDVEFRVRFVNCVAFKQVILIVYLITQMRGVPSLSS